VSDPIVTTILFALVNCHRLFNISGRAPEKYMIVVSQNPKDKRWKRTSMHTNVSRSLHVLTQKTLLQVDGDHGFVLDAA
jgi:hypothetical protein